MLALSRSPSLPTRGRENENLFADDTCASIKERGERRWRKLARSMGNKKQKKPLSAHVLLRCLVVRPWTDSRAVAHTSSEQLVKTQQLRRASTSRTCLIMNQVLICLPARRSPSVQLSRPVCVARVWPRAAVLLNPLLILHSREAAQQQQPPACVHRHRKPLRACELFLSRFHHSCVKYSW